MENTIKSYLIIKLEIRIIDTKKITEIIVNTASDDDRRMARKLLEEIREINPWNECLEEIAAQNIDDVSRAKKFLVADTLDVQDEINAGRIETSRDAYEMVSTSMTFRSPLWNTNDIWVKACEKLEQELLEQDEYDYQKE